MYTSRFHLTGFIGLILRSNTVATASYSTFQGTLMPGSDAIVTGAEYPKWYSTCSSNSGTSLYETNIAGQEESGCVLV